MDSEKPAANLRDGILPEVILGSKKDRVGHRSGRRWKNWETYQSESIASIGWNDIGDLFRSG